MQYCNKLNKYFKMAHIKKKKKVLFKKIMRFLSIYISHNVRVRKWKEVTSINARGNCKGTGSSP